MVVRIAKHQQADKARHVSNRQENKGITRKPSRKRCTHHMTSMQYKCTTVERVWSPCDDACMDGTVIK